MKVNDWKTLIGNSFSGVVGLFILWNILVNILATDHALDLTDEGLYLLAADPPTTNAAWGFPWGWHTGILFRVVGYDIAAFRTFGAVLLVSAGGWVGWSAMRSVVSFAVPAQEDTLWLRVCAVIGGAVGSLFYYASLLSTPSYNWINLFGILIAAGGFLTLCCNDGLAPEKRGGRVCLASLYTAFGLFLTIPAKPSTAPLLLVLGSLLLMFAASPRWSLLPILLVVIFLVGWILLAVAVGLWRWPLTHFFSEPFNGPKFMTQQTVLGAVKEIWLVPFVFISQMRGLGDGVLAQIGLGALMVTAATLLRDRMQRMSSLLVVAGLCLVAFGSLHLASATFGMFGAVVPVDRLCFAPAVTACIVFSLAAFIIVLSNSLLKRRDTSRHSWKVWLLACFLSALPFVFAFGSGNGPYRQAAMALVFIPLAALVSVTAWPNALCRNTLVGVVLIYNIILVVATLVDSHALPYRGAPISQQTQLIRVGNHNAELFLAPSVARQLVELRRQAEGNGWKPKTPLFGVVWSWASTVPYYLGARVPDCLMLTLFGYRASAEVAQYKISKCLGSFPSREAWLLSNNPAFLDPSQVAEINSVLKAMELVTGARFPESYQLVASSGNLQLWRPRAVTALGKR